MVIVSICFVFEMKGLLHLMQFCL